MGLGALVAVWQAAAVVLAQPPAAAACCLGPGCLVGRCARVDRRCARLGRHGAVEDAAGAAEQVEVLAVLAQSVEQQLLLVAQVGHLLLLLLDDALGQLHAFLQGVVLLEQLVVPCLELQILGLRQLCGRANFAPCLPRVLGLAQGLYFAPGHLVLDGSALSVLVGLHAQQVVLQFVVCCLHLEARVFRKAGLQHHAKIVGRSAGNLIGRRRHKLGSAERGRRRGLPPASVAGGQAGAGGDRITERCDDMV